MGDTVWQYYPEDDAMNYCDNGRIAEPATTSMPGSECGGPYAVILPDTVLVSKAVPVSHF